MIWGRSLGGAVAIPLAADATDIDGLIAESTFTSLADMGARSGIPMGRYLVPYRFSSLDAIARVAVPILLVHGDRDEVVPYTMGERLRDAARSAPQVTFVPIRDGGHNGLWAEAGDAYWTPWLAFLDGIAARAPSPTGPPESFGPR